MNRVQELFSEVYGLDLHTVSLEDPWELKGNVLKFTKLYINRDEDGTPYIVSYGGELLKAPAEREVPLGYLGAVSQFIRTQWG